MDEEDKAAVKKQIDDAVAAARTEWSKTRGWRHDRFASIKADPQAAGCMFIVGAAVWHFAGPYALKFVGL